MRLLIMDGNAVANIIDVDPLNIPPEFDGAPVAPEGVGIGMVWNGSEYEAPPAQPVTPEQVRAEAARRITLLAVPYTREERETWPVQIAEAEAFALDPLTPVPMLTTIAAPRGLTVEQMAALVLTLRDSFKASTAAILAAQATILALDPIPQTFAADENWP